MPTSATRRRGLWTAALLILPALTSHANAQWLQRLQGYTQQPPKFWPTTPQQVYQGPEAQVAQMPVPSFPRINGFKVLDDLKGAWETQGTPAHSFQNWMRGLPGGNQAMDRFQDNFLTPSVSFIGKRPLSVYSGLEQMQNKPTQSLMINAAANVNRFNEKNGWDVSLSDPYQAYLKRNRRTSFAVSSGIGARTQQQLQQQALATPFQMAGDLWNGTTEWAGRKIGQGISNFATGNMWGRGNADAGNQGMPAQDSMAP